MNGGIGNEQQLSTLDPAVSASRTRELKRKLKRGPRLGRKELAAYLLGLIEGAGRKFCHDPAHADRPGTPPCRPAVVPKPILDLLERIPEEQVTAACDGMGHPSFWLGPGYRYRCVCGEVTYKD